MPSLIVIHGSAPFAMISGVVNALSCGTRTCDSSVFGTCISNHRIVEASACRGLEPSNFESLKQMSNNRMDAISCSA